MKTLKVILVCVIVAVVAFIAATVAINAYCILGTRGSVHTIAQMEENRTKADAIVVLGASVFADGHPSDILADRLEVASDLYLSGAAPAIIVSGDNRDSHYNESDAMKAYCVRLGVPEEDVYVDHAGYNSYASMYRAKNVFGANSVIVVTQAYHLYRCLMVANMLGMHSEGVAADKGAYDNQSSYSLRDVLARDKDFFQALFKIAPEDSSQPITNN